MNVGEFSNGFDTLVNSYRRFKDFDKQELLDSIEFDEYEKSLYLTKAQEELVIALYTGNNPYRESFEQTEELRRYLSDLVEDGTPTLITNSKAEPLSTDKKHLFYTLPENVWYITYEAVQVNKGCKDSQGEPMSTTIEVVPVKQDEYHRLKKNPFRGANNRRVLRADLSDGVVELISKFDISEYHIRYLRKPTPIILEDLPASLTINGIQETTECELHEALHQKILEEAVMMALRSKGVSLRSGTSEHKREERNS